MAKRESAKVGEVIDVAPAGVGAEEYAIAVADGSAIASWVQQLRQFFGTAQELERGAQVTLEHARALQAPTDAAGDVAIQKFIKRTTEDRKAVEAHWQITSVIHRFHRRLTSKRDLASKALEEANTIGNRLHNAYTEAEKRRAAREEQLRREAAEFQARQEREQELARLEAEAVEAEEASPELSAREQVFVDQFAACGNGQASARVAGYKDPIVSSARLLSNAKIQMAIKTKIQAISIRRQAAARAAAPVEVEHVEVKPAIQRAAGMSDRTTWTGEVMDEAAVIEAFRSGKHGIPGDLFMVNPAKANEYARALHERLDLWPGMRAKKTTRAV